LTWGITTGCPMESMRLLQRISIDRSMNRLTVFLMRVAVRVFISSASRSLWQEGTGAQFPPITSESIFAVRQATKRDKTIDWFVASIIDLPFAPSSCDVVLNIFSPVNFTEFSRVLNETGILVIVSPGPRHLYGLREIIYSIVREHAPSAMIEQARGLFSPLIETRTNYQIELMSSGEIMDLLAMTPYFWNIDLNTKSRVEALDRLTLDVDVEVRVFRKTVP
jgi:SAM-dependent methyltransferase